MTEPVPRTAAAYIRVSTEEQAEQSPESQLVEIRKYAKQNNIILPDDLIYMDEGISGKRSENRPAFQRMIGAAKETPAPFDMILLWKFSRFARNQEESIVYKALLRKQCGVDVVSVSEQLPGGPFASLIERIIEWFDEFYSIRLAQEVKRSMTVKATKGDFQSKPPFGYRINKAAGKKGVLEIVPEEAAIVREIFDRFVAGEPLFTITRSLNSRGLKSRDGGPFQHSRLKYMIQNPTYTGMVKWTPTGRIKTPSPTKDTIVVRGEHKPIIDADLFRRAQERFAVNRELYGYKARPTCELKDWLSGIVRCAECGKTLISYKKQYFKCCGYCHGQCEHIQLVKCETLHDAVIERLQQDISGHNVKPTVITRKQPDDNREIDHLHASISDLQRKAKRLFDAYLNGAIGLDQFREAKTAIETSISEAERRLNELTAAMTIEDPTAVMEEQIRHCLDVIVSSDVSLEAKNNALRQIVEQIVFSRDRNLLEITYRLVY